MEILDGKWRFLDGKLLRAHPGEPSSCRLIYKHSREKFDQHHLVFPLPQLRLPLGRVKGLQACGEVIPRTMKVADLNLVLEA